MTASANRVKRSSSACDVPPSKDAYCALSLALTVTLWTLMLLIVTLGLNEDNVLMINDTSSGVLKA